jgi:hypothetical protein
MANASCSISAPCCRQGWGMRRLAYIIAATPISRQLATHTNYLAPCRLAPYKPLTACIWLAVLSAHCTGVHSPASRGMKHVEHKHTAPTNSCPLLVSPNVCMFKFCCTSQNCVQFRSTPNQPPMLSFLQHSAERASNCA